MTKVRDIVTEALRELRIVGAASDPAPEDAVLTLNAYNRMVASWAQNGVIIGYPVVTQWRREWESLKGYAVGDGVNDGGKSFVCKLDHTSSVDDEPGRSINSDTYWTPYAYVTLALGDTFPLIVDFEEGVIAMLARTIAGRFGKEVSPDLAKRARAGWLNITSNFLRTPDAQFDPALVRLPSRRWPYSVPINEIQ